MRSFLQKIFFIPALLCGIYCNAQVKFSASISPSQIGKDEFAQLKLMVENAKEVQQIVPPDLKDFIIISGPNQESGMTMINGVVKKYIALSFILKPKRTGSFIVPAAMAKADAGDYKSNPVSLKVTTTASGNKPGNNLAISPFSSMDLFDEPVPKPAYSDYILRNGENPVDKIRKNMFVKVEVEKKSCYVGEPIVASYKLFTRLKSESNMIKNPSFNGFSVLDLQQPNDLGHRTEKFEGRDYNVYVIRKVQLYPLLSGELELGVAEIENIVHFLKEDYINRRPDIFNDMYRDYTDAAIPPEGMEVQKVNLQSKPLTIFVKPLPSDNKPANFKGAVGHFEIVTKVEKNNFSTDDAGKLAIIISGEGNMQLINAPVIAWPSGIEGFDPKAKDDLYKGTVPVSGRKIFEFPFTVSKAGSYTIPPVDFSFFDTREGKYITVTSRPVDMTITPGTGKPEKLNLDPGPGSRGNYLTKFFSNRLRVVSLFTVLIIIGLIVWLKRDVKMEKMNIEEELKLHEEMITEQADEEILLAQENPLSRAEESLQKEDSNLFFAQLNLGLKNYLSRKLSIPAEELNRKNIAEQLDSKGVNNETAVQLQELIDEIEWQLYTPFTDAEKKKEILTRANDLVQLMNTYRS